MIAFLRWLRDLLARAAEAVLSRLPYGAYKAPWRWDWAKRAWILGGSERKPYTCVEYTIARIERRAPRWGNSPQIVDLDDVEPKLRQLGWVARQDECNCGCGEGQSKNCVAVYKEGKGQSSGVYHVAIFDHVRCDWGSKLKHDGPIARFRRPTYYLDGTEPESVSIVIYCPRKTGDPGGRPGVVPSPNQETDEALHARAHPI